ncbi:MAG: hypothetical protein ACK4UN_20485 [Limisphaerales bacterium]
MKRGLPLILVAIAVLFIALAASFFTFKAGMPTLAAWMGVLIGLPLLLRGGFRVWKHSSQQQRLISKRLALGFLVVTMLFPLELLAYAHSEMGDGATLLLRGTAILVFVIALQGCPLFLFPQGRTYSFLRIVCITLTSVILSAASTGAVTVAWLLGCMLLGIPPRQP